MANTVKNQNNKNKPRKALLYLENEVGVLSYTDLNLKYQVQSYWLYGPGQFI